MHCGPNGNPLPTMPKDECCQHSTWHIKWASSAHGMNEWMNEGKVAENRPKTSCYARIASWWSPWINRLWISWPLGPGTIQAHSSSCFFSLPLLPQAPPQQAPALGSSPQPSSMREIHLLKARGKNPGNCGRGGRGRHLFLRFEPITTRWVNTDMELPALLKRKYSLTKN